MNRRAAENAFTDEMRMYTDDMRGNRILAGLSLEETDELEELNALNLRKLRGEWPYQSMAHHSSCRDRYLELHDKHELARLQIIFAEVEARQNSVRN